MNKLIDRRVKQAREKAEAEAKTKKGLGMRVQGKGTIVGSRRIVVVTIIKMSQGFRQHASGCREKTKISNIFKGDYVPN
jgi:hypothetical protein